MSAADFDRFCAVWPFGSREERAEAETAFQLLPNVKQERAPTAAKGYLDRCGGPTVDAPTFLSGRFAFAWGEINAGLR